MAVPNAWQGIEPQHSSLLGVLSPCTLNRGMLAGSRRSRKGRRAPLHFASPLPARPLSTPFAPITAHPATGRKETATIGFALDSNTVRELAAAIGAEVVQAMHAERIPTMITEDREIFHVGPLTVDLGRLEAAVNGRVLDLRPRELQLLATLARNAGRAVNDRR